VKRPDAVGRRERGLGGLGGGERGLLHHGDEGAQLAVQGGDAIEVGLHHFHRRDVLAFDEPRQLQHRRPDEVAHSAAVPIRGCGTERTARSRRGARPATTS
jgi:hypothetical protein